MTGKATKNTTKKRDEPTPPQIDRDEDNDDDNLEPADEDGDENDDDDEMHNKEVKRYVSFCMQIK